ncbi:MarR family transcriptional regulator [Pelomonas sp. KK5]|uniref:MarR family transcriptional regulator n=1 Tax=Pelomonas sp. KK5 TaxID=1855730 RepID=UPI00097C2F2C|nr:MarR family transcriptional regulator [Pelomonas sp. KK5]
MNDVPFVQAGAARPHLEYSVLMHEALQEAGVSYNQFLVMASLFECAENRATPSELSVAIRRTRSNVTLICNQLEVCGWVTRLHGCEDRRRVDITLTVAGEIRIRALLFKLAGNPP